MYKKLICLTALIFVMSMVFAGIASAADPSLVAWYRFDGDATDNSGNRLHGAEMGDPTYMAGVFGQAISLDGYGDYVDCGNPPEFDITDFITFTYWIKVVQFDKGWNTVLSKGDDSWRSSRAAWNNFLEAAVTGTTGDYTYGVTPVNDRQWHHVGFVYDGKRNYLYVDGELDASEPSTGRINVSRYPLWIGGNAQWPGGWWNGLIDDVQIYNRALSQEEVQIIMQGSAGEYPQAWGQHRAAYYDERYRTSWATMPVPERVRHAFEDVGYEILDADQLKMWMDARIADGAQSVVVFCRDNAPDTVVESNSSDCTLRKYLDAGGKVVFYGDIPFWDVGHSDGTWENYEGSGCANILGIPGVDWSNDTGTQVTITAEGAKWGLTETWTSNRWTPDGRTTTVLATDARGNAAAWVKHFVPGDTVGGFVRIWDFFLFTWNLPNVDDLIRVTEYGMPGNPYARCPSPADGAVHALTWARMSWYPGDFAVSHDVYFGENFDDVNDGTEGAFRGNQAETFFVVGLPGYPYPHGLVPGTTYYWRIDEVNDLHPDSPWKGDVWSFSIPSETVHTPRHFEITYYDNYNYDTDRWDAWQSDATPRDAWDDKYRANGLSGNTVFTDHAFTSIAVFNLRGGLFSKDGHASGGEDWNPLQSIRDNVSEQSAHHVFAALFKGLIYLEEGDVLWVASDDDVYIFLDDETRWGQEVLSVPYISNFSTDSMTVTAAQAGYHMMTVKYIERRNIHSGIEITLNGEHLQSAEISTTSNLGSTVNSAYWEASPSISADGLVLFFDSDRPAGSGERDLYVTTRATKDDDWGRPVNLGQPVNTPFYDGQPGISANGYSLYFSSDRPGGFGNQDLWVTTRPTTNDVWGTPVNLGPTVNSSAHDTEPSISTDGLTLFFDSDRPGGYGSWDLWMVTRASTDGRWRTPLPLPPPVNSAFSDGEPSISADGRTLYFCSNRPGGYGTFDLWVATRETTDDEWGTPFNLGPIVNTTYHDWGPSISADGLTLYFTAEHVRNLCRNDYDLWRVSLEVLGFEGFETDDFSKFP